MSCERICPLVTLVCVLFFGDCHVRIQKKTHVALLSPLIKFERMSCVFSQNCLNKSQIPCNRKVAWKTNTLELLCIILGFEEIYFFFNVFYTWMIWFRESNDIEKNMKIYFRNKADQDLFLYCLRDLGVSLTLRFCPNEYLWARWIK